MCHGQKSRFFWDGHPTFNRNPSNDLMGPYKLLRDWVDEFIPYYMEMSWEFRPWHICNYCKSLDFFTSFGEGTAGISWFRHDESRPNSRALKRNALPALPNRRGRSSSAVSVEGQGLKSRKKIRKTGHANQVRPSTMAGFLWDSFHTMMAEKAAGVES